MTAGGPRVIRIEKLPAQWSLIFALAWGTVVVVPAVFATEWFLTPILSDNICQPTESYPFWERFIPSLFLLLPPACFGVIRLIRWAWRRHRRPRLPALSTHVGEGEVSDGALVRLRGRVHAPAGFRSRAGRGNVVIASYLTSRRDYGQRAYLAVPLRVLEATDFQLLLADGQEVRVQVAGMRGLEAPHPDRDLVLGEATRDPRAPEPGVLTHAETVIAEGDAVEVTGVLVRQVDPAGQGSDRGGRLIPSLRSEAAFALCVQPLDEPFFAPEASRRGGWRTTTQSMR